MGKLYSVMVAAPLKVSSAVVSLVGAIGTIWPDLVQRQIGDRMTADTIQHIGIGMLVFCVAYFFLLWRLKPDAEVDEPSPTVEQATTGPHSPNLGSIHGNNNTFHFGNQVTPPPPVQKGPYRYELNANGLTNLESAILNASRSRPPKDRIWQALVYISGIIGGSDFEQGGVEARRHLRQAARDNRIQIWGQKEIYSPELSLANRKWTELHSIIPSSYWEEWKIIPDVDALAAFDKPQTASENGLIRKECYWNLLVDMDEIKREWPKARQRPTTGGPKRDEVTSRD